jgi:hypothetical protein
VSPHVTQMAVLVIGWCRVRCRTFLEYGSFVQNFRYCSHIGGSPRKGSVQPI